MPSEVSYKRARTRYSAFRTRADAVSAKRINSGFIGIIGRHPDVPKFWRECGLRATARAGKQYSSSLPCQWGLVLDSGNIPFRLVRQRGVALLFVPPLRTEQACAEICAFLREPPLKPNMNTIKNTGSVQPIFLVLIALVLWHALRAGWWGGFGFSPEEWIQAGALSARELFEQGEWGRAATSLTLHADMQHLLGNCIFGGISLFVLALRVGSLNALGLSFFAGITGNFLSALLRISTDYSSIGASTAMFGAMGILCGIAIALRDMGGWRRVFFPLAAGFAWLAFLGVEGIRVDILAHVTGLCSGILYGFLFSMCCEWAWRRRVWLNEQKKQSIPDGQPTSFSQEFLDDSQLSFQSFLLSSRVLCGGAMLILITSWYLAFSNL